MKAVMDRVFIKLDDKENIKGGILLPEDAYDVQTIGRVVATGPEVSAVKVGDKVMFHAFDELPTIEKNVVVVRQNSLLAVLEDDMETKDEKTRDIKGSAAQNDCENRSQRADLRNAFK